MSVNNGSLHPSCARPSSGSSEVPPNSAVGAKLKDQRIAVILHHRGTVDRARTAKRVIGERPRPSWPSRCHNCHISTPTAARLQLRQGDRHNWLIKISGANREPSISATPKTPDRANVLPPLPLLVMIDDSVIVVQRS